MIFIQLAVLLVCIFVGARMSGIGLGVMGMIGLLILLFVFGMQPSDPPLEVMLIIMSVVTAAAALQAAGGMDYLVTVAGKILSSNQKQNTPRARNEYECDCFSYGNYSQYRFRCSCSIAYRTGWNRGRTCSN